MFTWKFPTKERKVNNTLNTYGPAGPTLPYG